MVMEIRSILLLLAALSMSLPAGTYAAKKESGKEDPVFGLYLNNAKSNGTKPNQDGNKPVKPEDSKPKQDDNKIVKYDDSKPKEDDNKASKPVDLKPWHDNEKIVASNKFEDELKELIKGQEDPQGILHICKKDEDDKIEIDVNNEHHEKPNVNTVPIPAAVWLFGSSLLGLFCHKRKKT
jgi:hypothetical protein